MDPLACVVSDLHDWIFQHFNVKDFVEFTEVSPIWNESCGKSRTMMKKVKLSFSGGSKQLSSNIENTINVTARCYRNVCANFAFGEAKHNTLEKFLECLVKLGPKLLVLEVRFLLEHSLSEKSERLLEKIDLSGLEVLNVICIFEALAHKLLNKCDSLVKLTLHSSFQNVSFNTPMAPGLKSFLRRNHKLKSIDLSVWGYKIFFKEDISEVARFELRDLKIRLPNDLLTYPEKIEQNLIKFLATQSRSLEKFHITECRSNVLEHLTNNMSALTSLSFDKFELRDLRLNLNENLTDLSLADIEDSDEGFEKIIRVVPNIRKLKVLKITSRMITTIVQNLPAIEALQFENCEFIAEGPVWAPLWPHAKPEWTRQNFRDFMDPLACVVSDLHDWIFQNFNVKDFVEFTEVSPNWNDSLGKSRTMMKKVKLSFTGGSMQLSCNIENAINLITRCYRNVYASFGFDEPKHNTLEKFLECLIKLGPKLLKLDVRFLLSHFLSEKSERFLEKIDLSRLEVLKVSCMSEVMTHKLLNRCNSLVKVSFYCSLHDSFKTITTPIPGFKSFLRRNHKLKSIELREGNDYKTFFKEDISEVARFELRDLKILNQFGSLNYPEKIERNLIKFLASQSRSLEKFQITECSSNVVEYAINKMSALTSLSIKNQLEFRDLQLSLNENLTDLSVAGIENSYEGFEKIIRVVPNLRKLKAHTITSRMITSIAQNLPAIEALQFNNCEFLAEGSVWTPLWPHAKPEWFEQNYCSSWLLKK